MKSLIDDDDWFKKLYVASKKNEPVEGEEADQLRQQASGGGGLKPGESVFSRIAEAA